MPILTINSYKRIEDIVIGDEVLSRDEFNPAGVLEYKPVLKLFKRLTTILKVHVNGQVIEVSDEHPFYVIGKGWTPANTLERNDQLLSHTGELLTIDQIDSAVGHHVVYNCEVADYHTYFVGCDEWGFSVWAHNADCAILFQQGEKWVLQSKVTGRTLFEGAEADVRAFAQKNGHDLTIPKAGDALSAEHRAARWQEYQDSFKAGGERAGETPISQTAWDSKYNLNMGRMSRSQAGVNEYRAANAPWAEPGEVYLKPSELPEGVAARHYDIANRVDKRAIEFKEFQGGQRPVASMYNGIKKEIAADVLMREKGGWNVEWVLKGYTSLSKGLKEALDAAKIPYRIIP